MNVTLAVIKIMLCCGAGALVGVLASRRLSARRRYFEETIALINSLIGDFRFRQTNISELLSSFGGKQIRGTLNEFVAYASGKTPTLKLSRGVLTEREHKYVTEMFSALGTYDLDTQVFMLDGFKLKAEEFYAAARDKEARQGGVCVKLGALLGAAVGIMTV